MNKKHIIPTLEQSLNEDFYNPFEEDEKQSSSKPKHLADQGGMFRARKEAFSPSRIEYSKRDGGDYTVLAKSMFMPGEIVEICPIIFVGIEAQIDKKIKDTVFEIDAAKNIWGIVLGYGSLYKHSANANLDFAYNTKTHQMYFIAKRIIKTNEELNIDYGKDWWSVRMNMNKTLATPNQQAIVNAPVEEASSDIKTNEIPQNAINGSMVVGQNKQSNPAISGAPILGGGQS